MLPSFVKTLFYRLDLKGIIFFSSKGSELGFSLMQEDVDWIRGI